MYRNMVVLLDGSKLAEVVFRYAQELAGRLSLDLELLHVALPQEAEYLPMKHIYMDHMAQALCAGAEEIRSQAEGANPGRCIQAKGTVVVGDPAEEGAAVGHRHRGPRLLGRPGGGAGGLGIGHRRIGREADDLLGRRVDDLVPVGRRDPLPSDEQPVVVVGGDRHGPEL